MASQATPSIGEALEYAAKAIRNGDTIVGRNVLVWILRKYPANVPAWLWFAYITEDRKAKLDCYLRVLAVDPENPTAKKALAKYGAVPTPPGPPETLPVVLDQRETPLSTELEIVPPAGGAEHGVTAKLDLARRDLLDMGLRNKLLNYRPLKSKGVEIVDEKPVEVYRILVEDKRSMSFLPTKEAPEDRVKADALDDDESPRVRQKEDARDADPGRYTDTKLQTPYSSHILQSRLLSSYYAARTYMEEQGVNILFLALGMLRWYESEQSSERRQAPLILVPVELSRSSVKEKFSIRHTDDDIVENLSLCAKLAGDFGVSMPELDVDELDIAAYFQEVRKAVSSYGRWGVDADTIALGFFSYGKFLMFNDLLPEVWPEDHKPDEHPLLSGLLEHGLEDGIESLDDDIDIDELIELEDVHHVVDADGSQVLAIYEVNRGRNLVVQGPPGTGKSQTITNLIAEALGHEKTVLFVSEKMAALEVVKRRLDHVGLGDACLELHSQKTKKKDVLEELRRSLDLGKPKDDGDLDVLELKRSIERLDQYSKAVNEPIGESQLAPYGIYGQLIQVKERLSGTNLPTLYVDELESWSRERLRRALGLSEDVQLLLGKMGRPIDHPFWGSRISILLPADTERIQAKISETIRALEALKESCSDTASYTSLPTPASMADARILVANAEYLCTIPDPTGIDVMTEAWLSEVERLREVIGAGVRTRKLSQLYSQGLAEEAWSADVALIRQIIAGYEHKFWRALSPTYRRATQALAAYVVGEMPKSPDRMLQLLDAILKHQDLGPIIDAFQPDGMRLFGTRWRGKDSDWDSLIDVSSWMNDLHSRIRRGEIDPGVLNFIAGNPDAGTLDKSKEAISRGIEGLESSIRNVLAELNFDDEEGAERVGALIDGDFHRKTMILETWRGELERLQEVVTLRSLLSNLMEVGLEDLVKVSLNWPEAKEHLADLLLGSWLSGLLQRAMMERPILATFDREIHEHTAQRFCELDIKLLNRSRVRLAQKHWRALPRHQAGGQLGILQREFAKKRRHLPIRKLIAESGRVIQAIKPVFMMSPLSIAQFLPPGAAEFDVVIFDEASQVKPVDAFGAILRGKQIVVVGDERQLPPTAFFETTVDVDEDYSDSVTVDLESILGMCVSKGVPRKMLRWHYRSRHESLIAVSNYEFYDNKLVIFPSPDKEKSEAGLVYHFLPETVYDRGGSRKNTGEAREVALAAMGHARVRPDLSLGIATFSVSQQEAVRDQLELLRMEDSSCEGFFRSHPDEPFFVKNLENVQGDERDVILISVGYGRTADGTVNMNFGPLNQDGGERRLNVLITRARQRCEVFTNLRPGDIDLTRTQARGVQVLKKFLKYAESGELGLPLASGREPGSPFEEAVAAELTRLGHKVHYQVGTGGFFIDLAIVDPDQPGRYLLGVECDGATYHSARSARDRDRIRQTVLENLGWQIHRVWSTDWFRNPKREIAGLEESIIDAKKKPANDSHGGWQPEPNPGPQTKTPERAVSINRERPAIHVVDYEISKLALKKYGDRLHQASRSTMGDWVRKVVEVESPIHEDEVARRIVESTGGTRVGKRIRAAFDSGVTYVANKGLIRRRGKFLWSPDMGHPKLRSRVLIPSSYRKMELIAPEEIELAIQEVIKASYGIGMDELPGEVCRLFGFQRVTESMTSSVEKAVRRLLKEGEILEQGAYLALQQS